jgi:hypothetical protein
MNVATAMMNEPVEKPEEILGLLREQSALYARLESFAARQRSLVREDDTAPLLSLLADRQRLSVELTRLATRLSPVRQGWSMFRERFSTSQRTEADGLVSDVTQRLRRVIESDEKDARILSLRKQSVATKLHATHRVGQAISAYRVPAGAAMGADRLDEAS